MHYRVWCHLNDDCLSEDRKIEPPLNYIDLPPIPPSGGAPAMSWYMTKAPLNGLLKVRVCRDREQLHHPCLGLLLYYKSQRVESLGQIRWDREISQDTFAPIRIENGNINGKNYIRNILGESSRHTSTSITSEWQDLPQLGTVVWWFGHIGNIIRIYND